MSAPISIKLPWPPSSNNLFAGYARRHITAHYRKWRREAELTIMAARPPRIRGPVRVSIRLSAPDTRARDASNHIKAIEDALVRMEVISDDRGEVVREVVASWGPVSRPSKHAHAVVTITPLGEDVAA